MVKSVAWVKFLKLRRAKNQTTLLIEAASCSHREITKTIAKMIVAPNILYHQCHS